MSKNQGKVYLVGAGPGDPGLLTVRGRKVLETAQVVIYDALVNPALLDWTHPDSEKIYAGKRGKAARTEQSVINSLLVKHAKKGKVVARLKGGDPFMFGRGSEEAEHLARRKIHFEIVPGVSSVTAVPAYAGIPVTDRRHNSMLTVVTGHLGKDPLHGPGVDWDKISPDGTLVILMGMENFPKIAQTLLRKGWKTAAPVALVQWGTLPNQRILTGTLSNIVGKLKRLNPPFSPPAVIVVGSVVKLREKIDWFRQ